MAKKPQIPANLMSLFTAIANEHLLVETLEERFSDRLDFHECSVVGIARALQAAYEAGKAASDSHPADVRVKIHAGKMVAAAREAGMHNGDVDAAVRVARTGAYSQLAK